MERRQLTATALALAFVGCVVVVVAVENDPYRRSVHGIWHDAALKSPHAYRPQLNAARMFIDQKRWALALAYAQKAAAIHPERASGWINASSAAGGLRAWELCYTYLKNAFAIYPARQLAENLVYVCRVLGKDEEAARYEEMLPQLRDDLKLEEPTQ